MFIPKAGHEANDRFCRQKRFQIIFIYVENDDVKRQFIFEESSTSLVTFTYFLIGNSIFHLSLELRNFGK